MLVSGSADRVPAPPPDPLATIRSRFLETVESHAFQLAVLRSAAEDPATERQALAGVMMIAHRVSGVAATLGFHSLGEVAAELDHRLSLALKSGPLEARAFDAAVAGFHAALHAARIGHPG